MGSSSGETDPAVVGVAPMRLAVATRRRRLPASVADEEHERVAKQGLAWQQTAGHAVFWEVGATAQGADEGRAYALAGQMASAGEQLSLAHAAAVEAKTSAGREEGAVSDGPRAHLLLRRNAVAKPSADVALAPARKQKCRALQIHGLGGARRILSPFPVDGWTRAATATIRRGTNARHVRLVMPPPRHPRAPKHGRRSSPKL